jgi:hypothetical protein
MHIELGTPLFSSIPRAKKMTFIRCELWWHHKALPFSNLHACMVEAANTRQMRKWLLACIGGLQASAKAVKVVLHVVGGDRLPPACLTAAAQQLIAAGRSPLAATSVMPPGPLGNISQSAGFTAARASRAQGTGHAASWRLRAEYQGLVRTSPRWFSCVAWPVQPDMLMPRVAADKRQPGTSTRSPCDPSTPPFSLGPPTRKPVDDGR